MIDLKLFEYVLNNRGALIDKSDFISMDVIRFLAARPGIASDVMCLFPRQKKGESINKKSAQKWRFEAPCLHCGKVYEESGSITRIFETILIVRLNKKPEDVPCYQWCPLCPVCAAAKKKADDVKHKETVSSLKAHYVLRKLVTGNPRN